MKNEALKSPIEGKSVIVGHPDMLIGEGITRLLGEVGFKIIGKANTESSLRQLAAQYRPDIILFDWVISKSYVDIIRELCRNVPNSIIVIITKVGMTESFLSALQAGAKGYLSVDLSPQEFVQSLQRLIKGDVVISKDMVNGIKKELNIQHKTKPADTLSDREREVLQLVGQGSTNREMAFKLFVSEHTIKVHLRHILNKLNLRNRQQAAAFAAKEGLVKDIEPGEKAEPNS